MLRTSLASLALAACLAASGTAQTPTWKAELLGTRPPSWGGTWATAVNDAGLAVGNTYLSGYKRAWIAGPGLPLQLLPLPAGATYTQANDVNSAGIAVGQVLLAGGASQGVLWQLGPAGYEVSLLPSGPGGTLPFDATGINDAGDVVGKYGILGGSYVWNGASGVTQIPSSVFPKVPYDVNEQRQVVAGTYRMDLDTLVLEDLGNPVGTGYNYMFTELSSINDAGECAGYGVTATSGWPYLPVRYTDGPVWKVFSNFPLQAAGAGGLSASGDTVFQLGIYGTYVYVNGVGSIVLQSTLDPTYSNWDLTGSFVPAISRGARLACNGLNTTTGEAGIVLLSLLGFEDLGGAVRGALGDPVLSGWGSLAPGDPIRVRLASAAPNSSGFFFLTTSKPMTSQGALQHDLRGVPFQTDSLGRAELSFDWPAVPTGTSIYVQARVVDPAAAGAMSASNVLEGVTQ